MRLKEYGSLWSYYSECINIFYRRRFIKGILLTYNLMEFIQLYLSCSNIGFKIGLLRTNGHKGERIVV